MAKSNLQSILSPRSGIPALLQNLCTAPDEWLAVEDPTGRLLFGEPGQNESAKSPILQGGETVGWASGNGRQAVAASLLSHLVEKEDEKKKLGAEALHLYREINLIYNFSEKVAAAFSPAAIGRLALEEAGALLRFEGAALVLWDEEKQVASITAQSGKPFFTKENLADSGHFIHAIVTSGQAQIVEREPFVIAFAALKVKHRVMGSLLLARDCREPFTAADLKLLTTLAMQSASAIETILLLEKSVWNTLELEREKLEVENIKSLSKLKSAFFTNITHEFRTPLTVILGNLEIEKLEIGKLEIEKLGNWEIGKASSTISQFLNFLISQNALTRRNAESLLRLISQLLDMAKLESGAFQIQPQQGDVIAYLKYVVEPFRDYAEKRDLTLQFISAERELVMDFDPEQLSHVVSNLLSNAIKFTPPGGVIKVEIGKLEIGNSSGTISQFPNFQFPISNSPISQFQFSVSDTGKGIPPKDLPYVFDRFYQVEGTPGGTGIGLAHAQELVKLMGGNISVESNTSLLGDRRAGTVFTVELPVRRSAAGRWQAPPEQTGEQAERLPATDYQALAAEELPCLLIVEDNPDIVAYLQNCLRNLYQIETARDGVEGIEKALELIPDVIISDVMMPRKDGFEVVDTLKNDERTSHVPIILLTAKADLPSKLEGLRKGADAYLAKPFDREELLVRLEKLVEMRKRLKAHFRKQFFAENPQAAEANDESGMTEIEDLFIQKIKTILAENISDELFGLPELCRIIGMSRSQLFRKMKALYDESPSGFIRSYRLHRAKDLLRTTQWNISEVGYEVGFRDPAHFTKTFHDAFGMTPSAFRG